MNKFIKNFFLLPLMLFTMLSTALVLGGCSCGPKGDAIALTLEYASESRKDLSGSAISKFETLIGYEEQKSFKYLNKILISISGAEEQSKKFKEKLISKSPSNEFKADYKGGRWTKAHAEFNFRDSNDAPSDNKINDIICPTNWTYNDSAKKITVENQKIVMTFEGLAPATNKWKVTVNLPSVSFSVNKEKGTMSELTSIAELSSDGIEIEKI